MIHITAVKKARCDPSKEYMNRFKIYCDEIYPELSHFNKNNYNNKLVYWETECTSSESQQQNQNINTSETKDTKQTIEAINATIIRYILALCINQRVIEGDNELKKSSKGEVLVKI